MKNNRTSLSSVDSKEIERMLYECVDIAGETLEQSNKGMSEILQAYWESKVVINPLHEEISSILSQMQIEAYSFHTPFLVKDIILNSQSDIELIKAVKDEYKRRSQCAENQENKDIFTIIYYAAVAGGLVHHHKKITSYSYEQIGMAIAKLIEIDWLNTEIKVLFQKAVDYCNVRA